MMRRSSCGRSDHAESDAINLSISMMMLDSARYYYGGSYVRAALHKERQAYIETSTFKKTNMESRIVCGIRERNVFSSWSPFRVRMHFKNFKDPCRF
jgi:hypothetical protein